MWLLPLFLALLVPINGIRVPVKNGEDTADSASLEKQYQEEKKPTYYTSGETELDSYLIPPNPHTQEDIPADVNAPATRLLPPSPDKKSEYFVPIQSDTQSEWYPIQTPPLQNNANILPYQRQLRNPTPIFILPSNKNGSLAVSGAINDRLIVPIPSRQLEPPNIGPVREFLPAISDAQDLPVVNQKTNFRVPVSPSEYELPIQKPGENYNPLTKDIPLNFQLIPAEPTLALHLTPPKPLIGKYNNPTKLYPKKYAGGFKPVPIPIALYADNNSEIPKARPLKPFKPTLDFESGYVPYDEKKVYLFEKAEQQRKLKSEAENQKPQNLDDGLQTEPNASTEQEASETNFRYPGRNSYPAPLRQAPPRAPSANIANEPAAPAERTEFRMHGMNGPHSYQFGYDTGKGKNRQFRFEERDNDGKVRGHYGYVDKSGKLRVVNYNADPEHGFHAEAPVENE